MIRAHRAATSSRRRAMWGAIALHLALATLVPADAIAGRPLDTDDAATIARGTCQLESFGRRVGADDRSGPRSDFGLAPSCNPFGWGELLVGFERDAVGQPSPAIVPLLQVKAVPTQVSRTAAGWGFSATVAEGFVRGRTRPSARVGALNGIVSFPVARNGQIDANAGWLHEWAPADGRRDHATWGLAGEWALSRAWTIVAERTGTTRQGFRSQVGAAWAVSPRVTLDAAIGRRHHPDDRSPFVMIGVTIVSAAPIAPGSPPASPTTPAADAR